ncbi:MAG: hypothetical protein K1X71_05045 [Pirellulales bacterium]|nr:hypothetical protein [Pirellulales bacterium]
MNLNPLHLITRRFASAPIGTKKQLQKRSLQLETLERRALLAIDGYNAWHNTANATDVNNDGRTSAMDALAIINELNRGGSRRLGMAANLMAANLPAAPQAAATPSMLYDVNNDGAVSAIDALRVVNQLNAEADTHLMQVILKVTDSNGVELTTLNVGQSFELRAYVQDLRADGDGVFSAWVDVTYQGGLADVTGSLAYGADFPNQQDGDASVDGLIDEAGGFGFATTDNTERLLWKVPMQATAVGTLNFASNAADDDDHEYGIHGDESALDPETQVLFGAKSIDVVAPTASIANNSVAEGDAGTKTLNFTVTLSQAATEAVSIDWEALALTEAGATDLASATDDFVAVTGSLQIAVGQTTGTISVTINGDTTFEPNERFLVKLTGITGGNAVLSPTQAEAIGTINNDDAQPALSINDVSIVEGNAGQSILKFTISLSNPSASPVSVNVSTQDGTAVSTPPGADYEALTNFAVNFLPGETSKDVEVKINGDLLDEGNETFTANLSDAVGATIAKGVGAGTITDDDGPPTLSIADVSITEGDAGTKTMTFVATLSASSAQQVRVSFGTQNGTASSGAGGDYVTNNGLLTFAPGETEKSFTVTINGDLVHEADEKFLVKLTNSINATIADDVAEGTILNDDAAPTLAISSPTIAEGNSGTTLLTYTITRTGATALPTSVTVSTTEDGTAKSTAVAPLLADFTAKSEVINFAANETSKEFTVTVLGDAIYEADETLIVRLTEATGATITTADGVGTITNDDTAPKISIADSQVVEGDSGTTNITFTITLSSPSGQPLPVVVDALTTPIDGIPNAAKSGGSIGDPDADYLGAGFTVEFAPGETSKTVTYQVFGDTTIEADEIFKVRLANAEGATIDRQEAIGTILDDDAPSISISDVVKVEGNTGNSPFTQFVFNVTLSKESDTPISVNYNTTPNGATAGADFEAVTNGVLTFAAGETSKTITINVVGDTLDENDEGFRVVLSNPTNLAKLADATAEATITDDDASPTISITGPTTVEEGDSGLTPIQYTISLNTVSGRDVTFRFALEGITATVGQDVQLPPITQPITILAGQTTATVTVNVVGDLLAEGAETFRARISEITNADLAASGDSVVTTITEQDRLGSISGYVYHDPNENGLRETGERGLEGVKITLFIRDSVTAAILDTEVTYTDGDGKYTFADLVDGIYSIEEAQPEGFTDGRDSIGQGGTVLGSPNDLFHVRIALGEVLQNYNFGEKGFGIGNISKKNFIDWD